MIEKKTIEENNIEAEATLEMSLRLLGGMEINEQMDTHEKQEVGGRERRKDDETKRRHGVLEKRYYGSTQKITRKNGKLLKKGRRKMENFSRKADDMMEKFLQVTSTVGNQIQGMNSSIVKMKEEGDDRYKQFTERITNTERKILDMDEKYENRSEVIKGEYVCENQGKTVITGFHIETTESEVKQLLKELINEVGMDTVKCRN